MSRRSGIRFADNDTRQHKNLRRYPAAATAGFAGVTLTASLP
jgi:hypothetical protein